MRVSGATRMFRALEHRDYRLFWSGQTLSQTGNWVQIVGEGWLVYRLTGSTLALGAFGVLALLPVLPVTVVAGALVDRMSKRRVVIYAQLLASAVAMSLAILTWSGQVQFWHIVFIRVLSASIGALDQPARQTLLPELVERDTLSNAIALNMFGYNLSRIVGPVASGVAIGVGGEAICFLFNSLAYIPFAIGLLFVREGRRAAAEPARNLAGSVVRGFDYIRRDTVLIWLLGLMSVSTLLLLAYVPLMPAIARDLLHAGPEAFGILMTCVGVGALLGALLLARAEGGKHQARLGLALVALAASVILLTSAGSLFVAAAVAVLAGVGTAWMQTIFNTLVQLHVLDDMRGRTVSVYLSLSLGMQHAGGMQAGLLAELFDLSTALRMAALMSLVCTAIAFWRRPAPLRHAPALTRSRAQWET